MEKTKDHYRVIMVGSGGTGKSALTIKYMYEEFVDDYEPNKASLYCHKVKSEKGSDLQLDILDTPGQEDNDEVTEYYRNGQGFLLVFSVVEQVSLDVLDKFRYY
jgi:small GTP-binding protein